jgi:hypothetical protein
MTWFFVDDSFAQHPKVLSIPRPQRAAAVGLWTLAGTWCARNLTDGAVPPGLPKDLGASPRLVDALLNARGPTSGHGLWEPAASGWVFHDWAEWQHTREEVIAKSAARATAGRRGGLRSGQVRRSKPEANASANGEANANGIEPRPVPSRPSLVVKVPSRLSVADATPVENQGDDLDLSRIQNALGCDESHASKVALDIVGRSKEIIRDPTAYVLHAIGLEPARYRPTPTPPRYVRRGETA